MTTPDVPKDVQQFVEDTFATNMELPRGTWELAWSPIIDGPPAHVWVWHVVGEEEVN